VTISPISGVTLATSGCGVSMLANPSLLKTLLEKLSKKWILKHL
jgi:hypothetical protein